MKHYLSFAMLTVVLTSYFGCNNKKDQKISTRQIPAVPRQFVHPHIVIDSSLLAMKKDAVCYMPLWTGIIDTCIYKGKVYGFCSKDCKNDFLKNPAEYAVK